MKTELNERWKKNKVISLVSPLEREPTLLGRRVYKTRQNIHEDVDNQRPTRSELSGVGNYFAFYVICIYNTLVPEFTYIDLLAFQFTKTDRTAPHRWTSEFVVS